MNTSPTVPMTRTGFVAACVLAAVSSIATNTNASDHADPVDPLMIRSTTGGLTGLFVFPTKDRQRSDIDPETGDRVPLIDPDRADGLAIVLCVSRGLAENPPFEDLDDYTYKIFIDWNSDVVINDSTDGSASSEEERATARYGGLVTRPDRIAESVVIAMQIEESAEDFLEQTARLVGESDAEDLELSKDDWYVGVRDDPFIFPQFFGTNVIAMVVHIPYNQLPTDRRRFLIWATSERHGAQIDIVGRAQRTQLPRFDLLNTLHPSKHVRVIEEAIHNPGLVQDLMGFLIPPEFMFRPFDSRPDVLIFSKDHPVGYPNGRRLEDDVAKLACEQGDCQLFELSFAEPRSPRSSLHARYVGGRPTANDKPFLDSFPYLAEPWTDPTPTDPPALSYRNLVLLIFLILVAVVVILFPWFLYFRALGTIKRLIDRPGTA